MFPLIAFATIKFKNSDFVSLENFLTWPFYRPYFSKSTLTKIWSSYRTLKKDDHLDGKIIFHFLVLKYFSSPFTSISTLHPLHTGCGHCYLLPGPLQKLPTDLQPAALQSSLWTLAMLGFAKPEPAQVSSLFLWLPIALTESANSLSWTSVSCKVWPPDPQALAHSLHP